MGVDGDGRHSYHGVPVSHSREVRLGLRESVQLAQFRGEALRGECMLD